METSHSYEGLGQDYLKARKGSPKFASFMIPNAGLDEHDTDLPFTIVELGVGSGQQTELVEKELKERGITGYKILAYDKSCRQNPGEPPGQLDILEGRIRNGEISASVIPACFDFDGESLPLDSESVDLAYMAHVIHHLLNKKEVFSELSRILHKGSRLFILGVTLEDMKNHPLNEFFPTKYDYETGRYPTEAELKEIFVNAGFTYEKRYGTGSHNITPIDREFLASVENTTIDSAFKLMRDKDPAAFQEGIARVRSEVEKAEKSGSYRTYRSLSRLRVFWGEKI